MPRQLYLLRHAQSADKQVNQTDKARELTTLGMKEARLIGTHLLSFKPGIEMIFSSEATRAIQTATLVAETLRLETEIIQVDEELYQASVRTFLTFINRLDDAYQQVMCVGHNPTISYFAEYITQAEIGDMVPAGLAIIKFNLTSWKEVTHASGELMQYAYPGMLTHN